MLVFAAVALQATGSTAGAASSRAAVIAAAVAGSSVFVSMAWGVLVFGELKGRQLALLCLIACQLVAASCLVAASTNVTC